MRPRLVGATNPAATAPSSQRSRSAQ
jgi:hypothetical protein